MKERKEDEERYICSTTILPSSSKDDFYLELFDYSPEQKCEGSPAKVINNFDELIDFLEHKN